MDDHSDPADESPEEDDLGQDSSLNDLDNEAMREALAAAAAEGRDATAENAFMLDGKAEALEDLVAVLKAGQHALVQLLVTGARAAHRRAITSPSSRDTAYYEGRCDALTLVYEQLIEMGHLEPPKGG